ncbi:MAG: helix-turn-helix domain-containing protein [Promethearchaeota archaeon]
MTKKGEDIQEQLLHFLERNPDGLHVGALQKLIQVSRNSIYRYLDVLVYRGLVKKIKDERTWQLIEPIRPQTIYGFQYQAVLQGFAEIDPTHWDIKTDQGEKNFKLLGEYIFPKMKLQPLNVAVLKKQTHHMDDIIEYILKLVQEASTIEKFKWVLKLDKNGFPDAETSLAAILSFEGGFVETDPVVGNGFAQYYIIAGLIQAAAEKTITPIYGGRVVVDVLNYNEPHQLVNLGVYLFFNKENPFIDPRYAKNE